MARNFTGATLDGMSWRSRQLTFDNMSNEMSQFFKNFITDLGTQHERKSRKCNVETALAFSKRILKKLTGTQKEKSL